MAIDIIIGETGSVLLASNEPFEDEVVRVEFYADTALLVLGMADFESEGMLLNVEVDADLIEPLSKVATVYVMYMKDDQPVDGYEVPIIQIGTA